MPPRRIMRLRRITRPRRITGRPRWFIRRRRTVRRRWCTDLRSACTVGRITGTRITDTVAGDTGEVDTTRRRITGITTKFG